MASVRAILKKTEPPTADQPRRMIASVGPDGSGVGRTSDVGSRSSAHRVPRMCGCTANARAGGRGSLERRAAEAPRRPSILHIPSPGSRAVDGRRASTRAEGSPSTGGVPRPAMQSCVVPSCH
ncbi:hypothetical protein ANO14919_137890 [Xylariales sp. No.14919]|nr:hypothetical protein ANO14919_137890 [Xylariales sp. No.14919]